MHKFGVLNSIWSAILVQSLFFPLSLFADPITGLYFSKRIPTNHGFLLIGIEISRGNSGISFLAQELRYHSLKGWEEILYAGLGEEREGSLELRPNSCQVRANVNFGEKKGMVRRYDCTHLRFEIRTTGEIPSLSSSLLGTVSPVPLVNWLPGTTGEPVAVSFLLPGSRDEEGVWGFHLNGIGKNNPSFLWDQQSKKWDRFQKFESLGSPLDYHVYRWKRTFSD